MKDCKFSVKTFRLACLRSPAFQRPSPHQAAHNSHKTKEAMLVLPECPSTVEISDGAPTTTDINVMGVVIITKPPTTPPHTRTINNNLARGRNPEPGITTAGTTINLRKHISKAVSTQTDIIAESSITKTSTKATASHLENRITDSSVMSRKR